MLRGTDNFARVATCRAGSSGYKRAPVASRFGTAGKNARQLIGQGTNLNTGRMLL